MFLQMDYCAELNLLKRWKLEARRHAGADVTTLIPSTKHKMLAFLRWLQDKDFGGLGSQSIPNGYLKVVLEFYAVFEVDRLCMSILVD